MSLPTGRKPMVRIPSVPPTWETLEAEVNRKEELTQHTFKCVVGLVLLVSAPKLCFTLDRLDSKNLSICHTQDLRRLLEYCYDNDLITLGLGEDPLLYAQLSEIRQRDYNLVTVYLTAKGVRFYCDFLRSRHHAIIAGDIGIGPRLTDAILGEAKT